MGIALVQQFQLKISLTLYLATFELFLSFGLADADGGFLLDFDAEVVFVVTPPSISINIKKLRMHSAKVTFNKISILTWS